jgi:hypothetical protein
MDLVVRCVGEAPNGAVRNSALALTATAARQLPAQALQHVIQVIQLFLLITDCCTFETLLPRVFAIFQLASCLTLLRFRACECAGRGLPLA